MKTQVVEAVTARVKLPAEWAPTVARVLLACALVFFVLLGGTEAGRLMSELRIAGALLGGVVIASYLWRLPERHDLTDRLVLGGLLLFLAACVTSSDPRSSFDSATSALAYAGAFYLARGSCAEHKSRELAIGVLGVMGAVVAIAFLVLWGSIWLRWTMTPGAGFPPLDLRLPAILYRHQYPVAELAALLLPATLLLTQRRGLWPLGAAGGVATFLVAFLSGGRAVWLAGLVAISVALVLGRKPRLPFEGWAPRLLMIPALLMLIIGLSAQLASRLGTTSTIELRAVYWQLSLTHWLNSPVLGYGPGSFAREFAATGYYTSYLPNVPHAHSLPVQALFEGGLIGLAGVALVCVGVAIGIRRAGLLAWPAAAALTFFALVSLADNPAVVPFLLGPLIVWAAIACPRTRSVGTLRHRPVRWITMFAAGTVGLAIVATLAGTSAYDRAAEAAISDDIGLVVHELRSATALDPSFALYHRELAVWLLADGDLSASRKALETAMRLNPTDAQSLRAAALLALRQRRSDDAVSSAVRAVEIEGAHVQNGLTLAYVHSTLGADAAAHQALVQAVRLEPWLTAAPEWSLAFPDADTEAVLRDAHLSWQGRADVSARNVRARSWLAGLAHADPPSDATPGLRAITAALSCHLDEASQTLSSQSSIESAGADSLLARILIDRLSGETPIAGTVALLRMRDSGLANTATTVRVGSSPSSNAFYDDRYYDRRAIPAPTGEPLLPTPASGLSSWLRPPGDEGPAATARNAPCD